MAERQQRVMVFIDGSNLYYSLKERFDGRELDFERFIKKLAGKDELVRAYFFDARLSAEHEPRRREAQEGFFDYLRRVPHLEPRIVDLQYNGGESPQQKSVDVGLAVLMVEQAARRYLDRAVLVSADRDFVPACQAVKNAGGVIDIALFEAGDAARAMRDVADDVVQLDADFLSDCWRTT